MREVVYDIDLNLQEYDIKACMQNDDINLIVNIFKKEKPYDLTGAKATLNWSKPDGTPLKENMNIDKNMISVTLNKDYTDIKGKARLDIEITKEGTVSTFPLCLVIVEKIFQSNKVNNKIVELLDIIKMDEHIDEFLDNIKQKQTELSSQIAEIASTGTTMEVVQNKVQEMAEAGEIQAYTIADKSINANEKIEDESITVNLVEKNCLTQRELNFITTGLNLFDKDEIIVGYTLDSSGNPASGYSDQFYTDIPVDINSTYILKDDFYSKKIFLLDSNKKKIGSNLSSDNNNVTITTGDTGKYIRLNSKITNITRIILAKDQLPNTYEEFCHIYNKLRLLLNNIPDGLITKLKLDDELQLNIEKINALKFNSVICKKLVEGKNFNTNKLWSQGTIEIETNIDEETGYKTVTFSNTTESKATYQFSPVGFNTNSSDKVYAKFSYNILERSDNVVFRDYTSSVYFNKNGENISIYKIAVGTTYVQKFEIALPANSSFKIEFRAMCIVDFEENNYTLSDIKNFFNNEITNTGEIKINKPFISSNIFGDDVIPYNALNSEIRNILGELSWKGKTWVSYGDSITAQGGWQDYIVKRFGLIHINKGVGGTTVAGTGTSAGNSDARIDTFPENVDLVTIMFGTNDLSQNIKIGNNDGDITTYKGALGVTVRKIQMKYPNARIIIMSPPFRTDSTWNAETPVEPLNGTRDMRLYRDACNEIAWQYGCKFADMWAEMGVNVINFKEYLKEEDWPVHLGDNGKLRFAEALIPIIKTLTPLK